MGLRKLSIGLTISQSYDIIKSEREENKMSKYQVEVDINAIIEVEAKNEKDADTKVTDLLFDKYGDYIRILEVSYITKE